MATLEELLKERSKMLEDVLPHLFKCETVPSAGLISSIELHMELAKQPNAIDNIKSIKLDGRRIYEQYEPMVEALGDPGDDNEHYCPVLQCVVTRPWVGVCGHIFEESAMTKEFLKKVARCPVVGCNKILERRKAG